MRVRVVAGEGEIFIFEIENRLDVGIQYHLGQRPRFAGELQMHLFEMIGLDVGIAQGVNEIAGF